MSRRYTKKRRAERHDAVRQRIVEAAVALHQTIGPAATTVSGIAERAGVGRVTVYRHFPSMDALAAACSGHYFGRHPLPDPRRWAAIAEPRARLRAALGETYAYHRATEAMMTRVLADAREHPVMAPFHAFWRGAADVLAAPWAVEGEERLLRAAIALALSFDAWRVLVREQQLSDDRAIALIERLCCSACGLGGAPG
jgi:AcrR family transcriptional regulator